MVCHFGRCRSSPEIDIMKQNKSVMAVCEGCFLDFHSMPAEVTLKDKGDG